MRLSVPAQTLEVAREDVASAASRMTAFSIPGDESVRVPANGFNLAATITRPKTGAGKLPVVVLIGGSGPADRDGTVAGIPVLGQIAQGLVEAGIMVVRYDKRGIGQSGGRAETATLADYADDARAVVTYLRKSRKDVDREAPRRARTQRRRVGGAATGPHRDKTSPPWSSWPARPAPAARSCSNSSSTCSTA